MATFAHFAGEFRKIIRHKIAFLHGLFALTSPVCDNDSGNCCPRYRPALPRCTRGGAARRGSSAHRPGSCGPPAWSQCPSKIAAEADVLLRAELAHVINVVADRGNARLSIRRQEGRIEIHADPAAALHHRANLLVSQVAEVAAQRRRAGMGSHRRLAVLVDQIPETRFVQVARIRRHFRAPPSRAESPSRPA